MKNIRFGNKLFCVLVILSLVPTIPIFSENQELPKEVKDLLGTYTGSWIMYGIDSKGEIVEKMKWTDTIEAKNPEIKDGRAFVTTVDKMKFEGGIPPQEINGTEGYFLNEDGSLGDYYFESFGQVYKMVKLDKETWVYSVPAIPGRLSFLGFKDVISGRHVVVKEVSKEEGTEFHRISRVTTVNWKDQDGKSRWKQFISLRGYHKRKITTE